MAKVALLIAVSEYEGLNPLPGAVKDVEAMQRVLEQKDLGGFDQVLVLINPDNQAKTQEAIEDLFSGRTKDDLVLLFFSGHGIKDDNGKLYFATCTTRKYSNGNLIKSTAVPASFVHDIMNGSLCKRQVVILDCCFSGAFTEGMTAKDDGIVNFEAQLGGKGRAVLTSSSSTQYSFEQKGFDLSVYTRHLVAGIETGEADLNKDGWISVLDLHEYASNQVEETVPSMKPKIIGLKDDGFNIVVAKSPHTPQKQESQVVRNNINLDEVKLGTAKLPVDINDLDPKASYLHNFLEPYESFIKSLITKLANLPNNNSNNNSESANCILEIIRNSSEVDFVFVLRNASLDQWFVKSQSTLSQDLDKDAYFNILNTIIFPILSRNFVFHPAHHGAYKINEYKKNTFNAFVIVPLKSPPEAEVMVVCGLETDSCFLGDVYGRIVSSFYHACQKNLLDQPALIEATILDDLKKDFGFVSESLYERRFKLFYERLQGMVVYFEPILHLDPEDLFISGWEALARDPDSLTAPSDLFEAAELWGPRFTIELDQYFLTVATESYRQVRQKIKQNRSQEIVPLSVNVYPESLMRRAYFETVRNLIKNKVISPRNLILEISEKAEVPMVEDGIRLEYPLKIFKNRLVEYVGKLKIRFAIDDFGVGYASVSRLAGLNPSHVKIDREILHHQPTEIILRFVHELVGANNLNPANVIVEGVDEDTLNKITLHRLKKLGVSYIQGHIVGKPEPEIYRLSLEKTELLKKLLLEGN